MDMIPELDRRPRRNSGENDLADKDASRWGLRQLPGMMALVCVVAGTCWDRYLTVDPRLYCGVMILSAVGWLGLRWRVLQHGVLWPGATCLVMVAAASSAAAWHHRHWNWYPADEIGRFAAPARQGPRLVTVCGRWDSCVRRETSELDGETRVLGSLRVEAIEDAGAWRSASGRVQVVVRRVSAEVDDLLAGDLLRVTGDLQRIMAAMNPGEFDRQQYLRGTRTLARLEVANGGCVRRLARAGWGTPGVFHRWSDRADRTLRRYLGEAAYPVGTALLLGRREHLTDEQQDRFLRTGTVHLLAISGFHVGVLASGLLVVTRSGLLPDRMGMLTVMVAVWLFAEVTGLQAPVMRANLLVQLGGLAWWLRRHAPPVNSLCWSAVVVWFRCPSDLFQAGAQLSFLAVAILAHLQQREVHRGSGKPEDPLERLRRASRPAWERWTRRFLAQLRQAVWISVLVWAFTLPLVVEQFHVVALSAVLLNVVLWLPLVVALFSGFGLLLVHAWLPPVASLLAAVCRLSLGAFETPIVWADQIPWSRFWHPGIGAGGVLFFYALWSVYWAWPPWRRRRFAWALATSGILVASWMTQEWHARLPSGQVRCFFLAVGHGTCVVLRLPGGRTWLYDCGRMAAGRSAVEAVSQSLWSLGVGRLDRVVISHADADHYSLLPGLLERFRVREVVTGPGFWEDGSVGARELAKLLDEHRVVRRTCRKDDVWQVDSGVRVEVLHPPEPAAVGSDNANSVVLLVRNGPCSVLLPGDLEGAGTAEVLRLASQEVTVAMAPHHGSCQEDPSEFLAWCRPRWLVVSGRWEAEASACVDERLAGNGVEVLHTAVHGAVGVELAAGGVRLGHFMKERTEAEAGWGGAK